GDVDDAELRVARKRRPCTGVARVLGRAAEPGVVAELAALRHRVKRPQELARARAEGADIALELRLRIRPRPDAARRADDDDVAHDERRRRRADLEVVDRTANEAKHVDEPGFAELALRQARLGIE